MIERESKMQKEREIKEGRQALKQELDEERRKMKEDIMKKMKEKRSKQGTDIKVELVGVPDFMNPTKQEEEVVEKPKPWEKPVK